MILLFENYIQRLFRPFFRNVVSEIVNFAWKHYIDIPILAVQGKFVTMDIVTL